MSENFLSFESNLMSENSLSFESASKTKRQRRDIPFESLCKGIKPNGDQCSFACSKDSLYCKRHIPKATQRSIETNTFDLNVMVDSTTNTEGTMLDITTANNLILEFIDDRVDKEKQIEELIELYNILRDQLEELQTI